jgi:thioredoxin 1
MASEKVKTFTDADFDASIQNGVVLIDFWAEWCAPCRRLAPTVDQLAEQYNGKVTVAKLNIDDNQNTPIRYEIRGIPTLLLFKNGELKERIVGLAAKDDLVRVIDKHVADKHVA